MDVGARHHIVLVLRCNAGGDRLSSKRVLSNMFFAKPNARFGKTNLFNILWRIDFTHDCLFFVMLCFAYQTKKPTPRRP